MNFHNRTLAIITILILNIYYIISYHKRTVIRASGLKPSFYRRFDVAAEAATHKAYL